MTTERTEVSQRGVGLMSHERRRLFLEEESPAEPGRYGCPMLMRTRLYLSPDGSRSMPRCALGWALHNELEAARCAATDVMTDCWKVHPERTPVVMLPIAESGGRIEPEPAAKVAGD
jgi:hypothetical protein